MDQTGEKAQERKPKISKLAILSPLVVFFGFWIGVLLINQIRTLRDLGAFIFFVSPVVGLLLGIIACWKIHKSGGALKGYVLSISGIVLGVIMFVLSLLPILLANKPSTGFICASNMSRLGKAIQIYAHYDNNGRYPAPDKWCDLLAEHAEVAKREFVCRNALKTGDTGRCHYAINPNCGPNSPADTVLLFETKGGWNQFGGPELLTAEHHEGCNILFNDGHVRYFGTEHLSELKWDNEPKDEPKQ